MGRDRHYKAAGKGPRCGAYQEEYGNYGESAYEVHRKYLGNVLTVTRHELPEPLKKTNVDNVTCYGCLIHISTVVQKNIREKASL